jgi:hypothetical protein
VRDAGFKPKDYPSAGPGGVIPAETHNFLWRVGMQMISWTRDFIPREWADVAEGIAETTASQLFRVYPPAAGMYARNQPVFNVAGTATGGGTVSGLCTDGEQIYYINGTGAQYIVGADPADGSENWQINPHTLVITSVCTDGGFVYYTSDLGAAGLRRLTRAGAVSGNGGLERSCNALAANGEYCIGIDGAVGGAGTFTIWSGIQGTITEDGTYNTTSANLVDCAIDGDFSYVTGTRAGGFDVWCNILATRALSWTATMPTAVPVTTTGIATDGDYIYLSAQRVALTAGGFANLFILDKADGTLLFTLDVDSGNTVDIDFISVDDRYLYCVDDSAVCHVLRLRSAFLGVVAQVPDVFGKPACDGVSAVFRDFTTSANFQRNWMGGPTKTFMRCATDDVYRRPFYNRAVPTDGRI